MSFAVEVAFELLKVERNASNCISCVFAKTSSNVRKSNVSARCCLRELQKPCKCKEIMQNGGIVASLAAFGLEKRARLHKDCAMCDGHKTRQTRAGLEWVKQCAR